VTKEIISNKVATLRQQKGSTQEELAEAVSVSRQTISALEKGNYTPSILLAIKIAGFFEMPVEEVFKISYEK
jgi:putative transcriptional regulator